MTALGLSSSDAGLAMPLNRWRSHLVILGAAALALMLVFVHDVRDLVRIWWTSSTFEHCLFIPFLVGWLVHQRVSGLRSLNPVLWWPGLLWVLAGNFVWLLGDAAGVALLRHAALVMMGQGVVAALLGPVVTRALLFPLFYAVFMIPFGEEVVPPLQLLTAKIAMNLLELFGVPAHIEGIFITIPTGYFEVAEACSGAKFLIAMVAYAALVCHVCFRSWVRRAIFLIGAVGLSIMANGARAFATIYVAHRTSVDAAVGFDHVMYGWLFFGLVMAIVMAVAWPFFDRDPREAWVYAGPASRTGSAQTADLRALAGAVLLCLLIGPTWSLLSAARTSALPTRLALPTVAGWNRSDVAMAYPWKPRFAGADHYVQGRYVNARGQVVDLVIAAYARQREGRELVGFGQGAADPASEWVWSSPAFAPSGALGEQITAPGPVVRHVVSYYAVGRTLSGSAAQVKLATLKARLLLGDQRAAAILISAEDREGAPADVVIRQFLARLGPVQELADESLALR